jgi:hypothetical protein
MAATTDILVRYKADVSDLVNESQKAENAVKEAGKAGKKAGDDTAAAFDKAGKKAKEFHKAQKDVGDQNNWLKDQFNKLGGMIAGAFAIESVIAFGKESVNAFREAELGAKKLEFAIKNIAGGSNSAFQRLIDQSSKLESISIFSDDSIQQAQIALAQYGLTADQIEKLTPKIIDLASATGEDLNTATSKVISAINGQTRGLKESGLAFDDTGTKIGNFNTFLEKSEKFAGATTTALNTAAGAAANYANRVDNLQESIGSLLSPAIQKAQESVLGGVNAYLVSLYTQYAGFLNVTTSAQAKADALAAKNAQQREKEKKAAADRLEEAKQAAIQAELEKYQKEDVMKVSISALNAEIKAIKERFDINNVFVADEVERRLKAIEKIKKANEEAEKAERARIKADWEKRKPLLDAESERIAEQVKINQARMDREIKKEDDKRAKEVKKSNDAFFKQLERDVRQRVELEKTWKDKLNEYYMDNYQNIQEMERQGLAVIIESQQKAYEAKQKGYDDQIALQEKNIQRQKELADKGLANTLAFEERKQAELKLKQKREQQAQERLKKLEVFLNTYAEGTKTMKPQEALASALKAVALAELGSMLFAEKGGIIGEITDRTGIRGGMFTKSHASGDRLVVASPNEAILSERDMRALGGKQGFYDLRKMLHSGDFDMRGIPKMYQNFNPVGLGGAINIDALVQEQKKTTEALKRIPVVHTGFDDVGNVIETWQRGLDKKITIIKTKKPRTA